MYTAGNPGGYMEQGKEIIMAYLAGALDGDGSFSIIKRTSCMQSENRRIPRYRPCLQLFNLSTEIVQLLHKHLGGNFGKRKAQKEGWREQSYWYCTGLKTCISAIEKTNPYLVIKKERANFLLKFAQKSLSFFQKKNLEESVIIDRERDYLKMRELNSERSVHPDPLEKKSFSFSNKDTDWAYMGGLMDTDGSFQISRTIHPKKIEYSYELRSVIQMMSIKGINFLFKNCGLGKVTLIRKTRNSRATQDFHYRWVLTNREDLKVFLERVFPFLIFRKKQAETILSFIDKYKYLNRYKPEEH